MIVYRTRESLTLSDDTHDTRVKTTHDTRHELTRVKLHESSNKQ